MVLSHYHYIQCSVLVIGSLKKEEMHLFFFLVHTKWVGETLVPLGDGVEEGTMELVGAVGRAHHAAGEFEHRCCAFGAQHEHLKAVVDDSWVA